MARLARSASILLAAATLVAVGLAACGSGAPSDKEQIAAIVKDEGATPATLCRHLTADLLARLGGLNGCQSRAATAARDPSARASAVTVRGGTATATVSDRAGTRRITLVKQKGSWLISGVQ